MSLFSSSSSNSNLGIDIGSTSIKIVELKKDGGYAKLITYGFSDNIGKNQHNWQNNIKFIAKVLNKICKDAGVKATSAVSSLPTFSVFSSILNLANVDKKDISSAVHWEAKKVVPLPLDEMILDWKIIEDKEEKVKDKKGEKKKEKKKEIDTGNIRILLTGAPKTLVKKYIDIFQEANIQLKSLETETFSLIRSLIGNDTSPILLVELGASTTDVSIVESSIPRLNRSIDIGGNTITEYLSKQLKIDKDQADQLKYDMGINALTKHSSKVPEKIEETISPIINEIKYAINLYEGKNNKKTEKVILSGGSAMLPNFADYLTKILDLKVVIGDPWARISYPVELKPLLDEIGPTMAVAVGLALRAIE